MGSPGCIPLQSGRTLLPGELEELQVRSSHDETVREKKNVELPNWRCFYILVQPTLSTMAESTMLTLFFSAGYDSARSDRMYQLMNEE